MSTWPVESVSSRTAFGAGVCCCCVRLVVLAECREGGARRAMGGCQSLQLLTDYFHGNSNNNGSNNNRKHKYNCRSSPYWPCCLCCFCCFHQSLEDDDNDSESRETLPTWRLESPDSPIAQVWFLRPQLATSVTDDGDQAELSPLLQSSPTSTLSPSPKSPLVRLIQVVQPANETMIAPDVDVPVAEVDHRSPPTLEHTTAALSDFWNELGHTLQCLSYSTPVVCQVSRKMNGLAPTRISILPESASTSSVAATSFPFPPVTPPTPSPPPPPLPPSPSPSRDSFSRQPFAIRSKRKFIRVSSLREHSGNQKKK